MAAFAPVANLLPLGELKPQQLQYLGLIETNHRLTVDNRHGGALKSRVEQLLERGLVGANVLLYKVNALLR